MQWAANSSFVSPTGFAATDAWGDAGAATFTGVLAAFGAGAGLPQATDKRQAATNDEQTNNDLIDPPISSRTFDEFNVSSIKEPTFLSAL
jgi:hypothetical protein